MKVAPRVFTFLSALLCGAATGWLSYVTMASRVDPGMPSAPGLAAEQQSALPNTDPRSSASEPQGFFDRLHEALGNSNRAKRSRMIAKLTFNLDIVQIRDALGRLADSRIPNRKDVMVQLFSRWGELEPLAALEYSKSLARKSEQHAAVVAILNGWMELDPDAAEKWVSEQPNGALKNAAWEAVIVSYASDNPTHALALAQQIRLSPYMADEIVEAIFAQWALRDAASAAAHAARLSEGSFRTSAQRLVAQQWAESDPKQAMAWADSLPDRLPGELLGFGGVITWTDGADRTNAANSILETWIMRDPAAAIDWLGNLPDDPWKLAAVAHACSRNTELNHDPDIAVQLLNLIPEGKRQDTGYTEIAKRMSLIDPQSAIALLSLAKEERAKNSIMSGLASDLKGDNLLAALRQSTGVSFENITRWGDPETAFNWALQQQGNEKFLPKIAGAWIAKDPDHAAELVNTLPVAMKDATFSGAIDAFLNGLFSPQEAPKSFARAGTWIPEISDPTIRQDAYQKLAQRWLKIEPQSARRWIDSIPISGELKSQLLKNLPNTK
jgi:hypothetical protein